MVSNLSVQRDFFPRSLFEIIEIVEKVQSRYSTPRSWNSFSNTEKYDFALGPGRTCSRLYRLHCARFRLYQKFQLEIFPNSSTYRRAYRQVGISVFLPLCRPVKSTNETVERGLKTKRGGERRSCNWISTISKWYNWARMFVAWLLSNGEARKAPRYEINSGHLRRATVGFISPNSASISRARSPVANLQRRIFIALSYRRMGKASSEREFFIAPDVLSPMEFLFFRLSWAFPVTLFSLFVLLFLLIVFLANRFAFFCYPVERLGYSLYNSVMTPKSKDCEHPKTHNLLNFWWSNFDISNKQKDHGWLLQERREDEANASN